MRQIPQLKELRRIQRSDAIRIQIERRQTGRRGLESVSWHRCKLISSDVQRKNVVFAEASGLKVAQDVVAEIEVVHELLKAVALSWNIQNYISTVLWESTNCTLHAEIRSDVLQFEKRKILAS